MTIDSGTVTDDVPGPDLSTFGDEEARPVEPLHPDDHVSFAVQLLDTAQILSSQGDQEDPDIQAVCALLASIAHSQIAQYELMRRGAANDGLISSDYRGPDLTDDQV